MPKILLVEDDLSVLEMLQMALEHEGYLVQTASMAKTALNWLREASKPDLIISDIGLPDIDGVTLCRMIKDDPALKKIPVIILTASLTNESKIKARLTAKADLFLNKPIDLAELSSAVKNMMDQALREKSYMQDLYLKKRFFEQK
ncbi:MAG: response regulator [Elusimicrobia bacterium]|nr:response regulator [Elusimicrobiota bacterium]